MIDLKQITEQFLEAITSRNYTRIREMLHDQYTYECSDGQKLEGPEAGIDYYKMLTNAFPDMHIEIRNMIVSGNIVATESINRATHLGELNGIQATNRQVEFPFCNFLEIREGKIYADRDYFDTALVMHQLGVEVGHEHA